MIVPTKHQDLDTNILVLGADILFLLKKETFTIEELFQKLFREKKIALDVFLDTITFLWLLDAISYKEDQIEKKCI